MVKNFEIRFKTKKELSDKTKLVYNSTDQFRELKYTVFLEKVFLLGLSKLQEQITSGQKFKSAL